MNPILRWLLLFASATSLLPAPVWAEGSKQLTPNTPATAGAALSDPSNTRSGWLTHDVNFTAAGITNTSLGFLKPFGYNYNGVTFSEDHRMYVRVKAGETLFYGVHRTQNGQLAAGTNQRDLVLTLRYGTGAGTQVQQTTLARDQASVNQSLLDNTQNGVVDDAAQAQAGPLPAAAGYQPLSYTNNTGADREFYLEFTQVNEGTPGNYDATFTNFQRYSTYDFWDLTVRSGGVEQPGRLHAKLWSFSAGSTDGRFSSAFALYPLIPDASAANRYYVKKFELAGINPQNFFRFTTNSRGTTASATDFTVSRKSQTVASGFSDYPEFDNFIQNPDATIWPSTAPPTFAVRSVAPFCGPTGNGQLAFTTTSTVAGILVIVVDLNGTPGFQPGTRDVVVEQPVPVGASTVVWNGLDGLGAAVPSGTAVTLNFKSGASPVNFPVVDAENNVGGFRIENVRPTTGFDQLFFDDTNLSAVGFPVRSNLGGTLSSGGVHDWGTASGAGQPTTDAGNLDVVNTYAFGNVNAVDQAYTLNVVCDGDGDGITNANDIDWDNDGISNTEESSGVNPATLTANGVPIYLDAAYVHPTLGAFRDVNGDGINDVFDLDLDGLPNFFDIDADNDGITDVIEANASGATIANYDAATGRITGAVGTNGMPDAAETTAGSGVTRFPLTNSDGNGRPDFLDIDADNDGIPDNIEGQPTATYRAPSGLDTDGDGLDNTYDPTPGGAVAAGTAMPLTNTDGADQPDYRDTDSDNDGRLDSVEGWDTDNNGVANTLPSGTDADQDGLDDAYDTINTTTTTFAGNAQNGRLPTFYPDVNKPGGDRDWRQVLNVAPVASNVTNAPAMLASNGQTAIQPLVGTDADGTVVNFIIQSLPAAAQGQLFYFNGTTTVAVAVGTLIPLANAGGLRFDPAPAFVGGATFTFVAIDNDGLTGNTATYTVPVVAPLSCQPSYLDNASTSSGLTAEYYAGYFADDVSYFQRTSPLRRLDPNIDFSSGDGSATWGDLSTVATGSAANWDTYSSRYRGSIYITTAGSYTFYLNSDDASYLWLDGAALAPTVANATVNNGGLHGIQERSGTITLTAGLHDLTAVFGENGGGNYFRLEYASAANNIARQVVPQGLLCAGPANTNNPPVAIDATNTPLLNTAAATVLSPNLSATDPEGNATVAYYNITTLPSAASGVLFYNGVAVVAGQAIPAGSLNLLTFDPAAGFSGNASFTYSATDNGGRTDLTPATYTLPLTPVADVTTALSGPTTLNAGQPSSNYTASFTNNGPSTAANVTQTVQLPAGVTTVVVPTGASYNSATRIIDFGTAATLNSGATNSFIYSFTAPTASGAVSLTSNVGTTTAQGPNTAPDAATLNATVNPVADVTTTLTAPASIGAGQPSGNYTATFTNNGPSTASTVTRTVTLPAGATAVVVPTGATYTAGTRVIDFGTLATQASGGTASFVFSYTAPTTGPLAVTSNTSTTTGQGPNTAPDAATTSTPVTPVADVTTALAGSTTLNAGQPSGNYTATFSNNGPSQAASVAQTVQLPAGVTAVVVPTGASYNPVTRIIDFGTAATLNGGATNSFVFSFTASTTTGGASISSTVSTTTSEGPNTAPNFATLTVNTAPVADVTTTLTGPTVVNPSQPSGNYTASFTNNGPNPAANVTQTVQLPAGVTAVVVPTGATYNAGTRVIDFGTATTLNSGATNAYVFSYAAPTTPGNVTLTSNVGTATGQGPNTALDAASLTVRVNNPPVANNVTNAPSMLNTANATAISPLSATDTDGTIASYTVLSVPVPNQGTLLLNGVAVMVGQMLNPTQAAQLSFDPSGFSFGNFTFTYSATDNNGLGSNVATYTIPVTPGPLTAYNDSNEVPRNTVATGNVLLNDANPGGAPLTVTLVTGPTNGTLVLNADGTYAYTPNNNYLGPDSFVYRVCDNGTPQTCSQATTSLRVYDPGTACSSSTGTNLLANADFMAGNTGFISDYSYVSPAANTGNGLVPEATYAVDVNAQSYHPAFRAIGFGGAADRFLIVNGAANVQRMYAQTIAVQPNRYYTFSAYFNNLLPPGSNNGTPQVGFVINGQSVSASLTVTESPDRWVKFSDVWYSGTNTSATFEIRNVSTALGGNDLGIDQVYFGTCNLPPVANNDFNTTTPGTPVSFSVTANDTDGDGTVSVNTVDLDPATAGIQTSFTDASGNLFQVNATGLLTFTPAAGYTGTASIPYVVQDNNNALSNPGTISVSVQNPTVDLAVSISAPVNNATVPAGQPVTFTVVQQNNGPSTAAGVQTTLQLPAGLTGVSFSNGGAYNTSTGLVTFPAITSQANAGTVSYGVTVNAPASGPIAATAVVRATSPESVPANNTAVTTLNLSPRFDVATALSGPTSVVQGNEATFTVVTSNNGPSIAPNVVQTVTLPAGLQNVFVSNGGTYDSGTGVVTFPALALLPSGQPVTNTISFTAPAAGFTATAAATPNTTGAGDTNPANNAASAAATAITAPTMPKANVYTGISLSAASVAPGGSVSVSVTTGNNGPSAAGNVATQVALLPGLTVSGLPTGASYDPTTGIVTFASIASLTSGTTQAYSFSFLAPQQGTVTATASVSSSTSDPVAADNVDMAQVSVQPRADVATTLAGPATATAGQPVTYTVSTQNLGAAPAQNVAQTVQLPTGLTGVTMSNGGTYNATTGVVTFPVIATAAAGSLTTASITFTAPAGMSSYVATAAVASTTPDGVSANNTAVVTTAVQPSVDVVVALSGPTTAPVFGPVTYAVTTTNNGPSIAPALVPTLQLPANLNGVVLPAGASYNSATGLVTFATVSNLPSGAAATSAVSFQMPDVAQVAAVAAATVSGAAERNLDNNRATLTTTSQTPADQVADLSAAVQSSTASTTPGAPVTFTATFANGAAPASDAALNVTPVLVLPAGLTGVSVSNGGTYNPATGVVSWPATASLAPAASLVYTVTVNAPSSGPLVATAAVSSSNSDPALANNTASTSVAITPTADVTTTVSGPATAPAGATVTYTATTLNNGPSAAANVVQTLTLPVGYTNLVLPAGASVSGNTVTFAALASQAAGAAGQVTNAVSFTAPAAATYAVSAAVSTATSEGANAAANTASLTTTQTNQAPVAVNVVNQLQQPMGNTAGALPISPLSATDADGTVASYTIQLLPPASQGVLYVNGVELNTTNFPGLVLTPAQAAQLRFDPASTFTGNVFLVYTALDNQGATSAPALYTIQVGQDTPSLYTNTPAKGGNANQYQNGDVISNVFDVNGGAYNSLAAVTSNGVVSAVTNAAGTTLLAGLGLSMSPTTGQITVTDRTKLKAGTYTLTITTVDQYGGVTTQPVTFTIGTNPLPVELTVFQAKAVKLDAVLSWTTALEKNNDHFDVERSLDGRSFTKIGEVKGQGSKSSPTDYALTDAAIGDKVSGSVYYRLQQVDADGTRTYSPVRVVSFQALVKAEISVYPNPATVETGATLDLTRLPAGIYQISLLDMAGRTLGRYSLAGGLAHALDVRTLADGTYVVRVTGEAVSLTARLIKK